MAARRRWWPLMLVLVLGLAAALAVVADAVLRGIAEDRVEQQVAGRLPDGSSDPRVRIGGGFFLLQYLSGRLESVTVDLAEVPLGPAVVAVDLVGRDVPVDQDQPVPRVDVRVRLDEAALRAAADGAAGFELEDGAVTYTTGFELLESTIELRVVLEASIEERHLVLSPVSAEAGSGSAGLDVAALLGDLDRFAVRICTERFLPEGMDATAVSVAEDTLSLNATGRDIRLTADALTPSGSCP